MGFLDVDPDDLPRLSDTDLRTLVGMLSEAEVRKSSYPTSSVTWGGSQDAADGGVDVRVELPDGASIVGYVPRPSTVFQVKKPDLAPADITAEMRPAGTLRPVIAELAATGGAYVIVSPAASLADSSLRRRRAAMQAACVGTGAIHVDFYDRRRLASWAAEHAGVALWVRERSGRPVRGWRPWGRWAGAPQEGQDEYLCDDGVRFYFSRTGPDRDGTGADALAGIAHVREALRSGARPVRLVELSGVGKTRFVEALFDRAVGVDALNPASAIYADAADELEPAASEMATILNGRGSRAVLVLDNCPPDLHRRLSAACSHGDGRVGLLTVEYDIRDDTPESTEVVRMEAASDELIGKLVHARFPEVSAADRLTLSRVSEGNARVALSLAGTIGEGGNLAGLSDERLFARLFWQRNRENDDLLLIAQSFSLFYSFHCGSPADETDELEAVTSLSGMPRLKIHRALGELGRRQLVQARGPWRAVLPHAVANRLARRALQDIPADDIEAQVLRPESGRLLRSLSRRLGFLHDSPEALVLVRRWLNLDGLLSDPASLAPMGWEMFSNIAPVDPEGALAAFERCQNKTFTETFARDKPSRTRVSRLLRHLAYEPSMFERSVAVLVELALLEDPDERNDSVAGLFASLFSMLLSGTHASVDQRLSVVACLLGHPEARRRTLGAKALKEALQTRRFAQDFESGFGARSRNSGYRPGSAVEADDWLRRFIGLATEHAETSRLSSSETRSLFGRAFPQLWRVPALRPALHASARRISDAAFWEQGWSACSTLLWQATAKDKRDGAGEDDPLDREEITALVERLAPSSLRDRIEAYVLSARSPMPVNPTDAETISAALAEGEAIAELVGEEVAANAGWDSLVSIVFRTPSVSTGRSGRGSAFGRGLLRQSPDPGQMWSRIRHLLVENGISDIGLEVVRGCIQAAVVRDPLLAGAWLDAAVTDVLLGPYFPWLQAAAGLDGPGRARIEQSIEGCLTTAASYGWLAFGQAAKAFPPAEFARIVSAVAAMPDGYHVAVDLLGMRFHGEAPEGTTDRPETALVDCGRRLLSVKESPRKTDMLDYHLAQIAAVCLAGPDCAGRSFRHRRPVITAT